jgi:hypothetical protein
MQDRHAAVTVRTIRPTVAVEVREMPVTAAEHRNLAPLDLADRAVTGRIATP